MFNYAENSYFNWAFGNLKKILVLMVFSVLLLVPVGMQNASALNLSWSGTGSSGADPLGHTWLVNFFGTNNWGTPGVGAGQLTFLGNDWVSDFHFTVNSLPPGCEIDPGGNTQFLADNGNSLWDKTITGNTVWFVAADQVADRLDPGQLFFVNVHFTCDITTIDFDAEWTMGPQLVGGYSLPIDSTSLILAGAQMTAAWMIPVIIAGIGFAIVIVRKF